MKATFFQKPLEFGLVVEGERWQQGDRLRGTLNVRNHGAEPFALAGVRVDLCQGDLKKVRAKDSAAFRAMSSRKWESPATVAPGETVSMDWEFPTDLNFPITDATGSPFLVYGAGEANDKVGHLQLIFQPAPAILEFLDVFKTAQRFVTKSFRWSKGRTEAKLTPPDSPAFKMLEGAAVSFHLFASEEMELHYSFTVKVLQPHAAGVNEKKEKREVEQSLRKDEYRLPSGRVRHDVLEGAIRAALQTALSGGDAKSAT